MNSYFANFALDDCYEILKKKRGNSTNIVVKSFEFRALEEKLGFLGEHCYLTIKYSDGDIPEEITFFAKSMPTTESQTNFAINIGACRKECDMFTKLVPTFLKNGVHVIQDCVPDCYFVSDLNYLIFDDLSTEGYRTLNQRESMPLDCVKVCLDALAKLHCTCFIFEEKVKRKTGKPYFLGEAFPKCFSEAFFNKNVKMSQDLIEASKRGAITEIDLFESDSTLNLELFKELTRKSFEQMKEIVQPSTIFRNTICHGDLWSTNLLLKFENDKPTHCRIVDFQSYRYGPPGQDFLAFIYLSTDREFRRKYLAEVTGYYYRKMTEILQKEDINIKKILPYSELIESCDYYKPFCVTQAINHFQLIMSSGEAVNDMFDNPETLQRALFEDKSDLILLLCEKDEIYRKRMLETILDLKEVFIEKGLLEYHK